MPNRHIDRGIKQRCVALLARGWTPAQLADLMDVSERSVYRWQANDRIYGDVAAPRSFSLGRPRLLTGTVMNDLLVLLENLPHLYLQEIREWLAMVHQIGMSKSALDENLREMGVTYKLLCRNAAERDEERRDLFREVVATQLHARMCVCLDESSKDERTIYRHYGRAPAGQRATISANFVRGQRYSILPAFTVDGYLAVSVIPGSFDAEQFTRFVLDEVVSRPGRLREPQLTSISSPR